MARSSSKGIATTSRRLRPTRSGLDLFTRYPARPDLPELPAALRDPRHIEQIESSAAFFEVVRETLGAITLRQPLVLVLEDLHWSDLASLELLRSIARQAAGLPLLLIGTYRSDELARRRPLYRMLPALIREAQATRIDLRGLDAAALRELLSERYRLPDDDLTRLTTFLTEHAEGNPFYVGEVLRSLELARSLEHTEDGWQLDALERVPVPPLVRQLIDRRLEQLDESTRRLLPVAAVIGQVIALDTWQVVAGADDEKLALVVEQAIDAHLLEDAPNGATLRFTHALVREALYAGTVLPRRRQWHRQIAEHLIGSAPAGGRPGRVPPAARRRPGRGRVAAARRGSRPGPACAPRRDRPVHQRARHPGWTWAGGAPAGA